MSKKDDIDKLTNDKEEGFLQKEELRYRTEGIQVRDNGVVRRGRKFDVFGKVYEKKTAAVYAAWAYIGYFRRNNLHVVFPDIRFSLLFRQ
jgi:hypothetical protein